MILSSRRALGRQSAAQAAGAVAGMAAGPMLGTICNHPVIGGWRAGSRVKEVAEQIDPSVEKIIRLAKRIH
jgi:hypothetical protein